VSGAPRHALGIRAAAFGALGLYGVLRWATLTGGQDRGRMVALLALALGLVTLGPRLARRNRLLAGGLAALAALCALGVAGIPASWLTHLRVSVTSQGIGDGLAALPSVLTPYRGSSQWVLIVITLGAAVLLLDSAIVVGLAPGRLGDLRRAVAALPLVALVVIPATLVRSRVPYLEGIALFALLSAFMWGERLDRRGLVAAVLLCAAAGAAALALAPGLEPGKPWVDYQGLANSLVPGAGAEAFDWSQRYGPIDWPRSGHTILEVKATRPDYWKTENLDFFDGHGWTQGVIPGAGRMPVPSPAVQAHWTQRIQVTLRDIKTTDVIGAGTSGLPVGLHAVVTPGVAPGTWTTSTPLLPGDGYQIEVYSPHPSAAQLAAAGDDYSGVPTGYLTVALPEQAYDAPLHGVLHVEPQVMFAPFHSGQGPLVAAGVQIGTAGQIIAASPYARMYRLARHMAARAPTPYAFARAVLAYLAHGFAYREDPPARPYPLVSFLFADKAGYCQYFAGAMALMLRMGGVPARVAVGFTPGTKGADGAWLSTDANAHAWVEAWFPSYGWVRFEPTPPSSDPAQQHTAVDPTTSAPIIQGHVAPGGATRRRQRATTLGPGARGSGRDHRRVAPPGGSNDALLPVAMIALCLGLAAVATRPLRGLEPQLAELERAFRRTGRPLRQQTTLASLEHRMRQSADAAAYVRSLRLARFADVKPTPPANGRRALRAHLAAGLGWLGKLRAWWALPPRWSLRRPRLGRWTRA